MALWGPLTITRGTPVTQPCPAGVSYTAWSAPMLAAVMADSCDSFQLVSVAEATRILNVSDSTVRRLLRAGRLEAQKVQRGSATSGWSRSRHLVSHRQMTHHGS